MKIVNLEKAILEAKKIAKKKLTIGDNADEFVEISKADRFKLYVTAGKPSKKSLE